MKHVIISTRKIKSSNTINKPIFYEYTKCLKKPLDRINLSDNYIPVDVEKFPPIKVDGLYSPYYLKLKGRLSPINFFVKKLSGNTFSIVAYCVINTNKNVIKAWEVTYEEDGAKKLDKCLKGKTRASLKIELLVALYRAYILVGSTDTYDSIIKIIKKFSYPELQTCNFPLYRAIRISPAALKKLKKGESFKLKKRRNFLVRIR